jgi:hypothetical protein
MGSASLKASCASPLSVCMCVLVVCETQVRNISERESSEDEEEHE